MLTADDLTAPATVEDISLAIRQVRLAMGIGMTPEREAAIVLALESAGYTRGQILLAGQALALDVDLDRKLRYPEGALTAADFVRVLGGPAGDLGRLYTYREVVEISQRIGAWPFEPVRLAGEPKPLWRRMHS